jgi:hypothetical protein
MEGKERMSMEILDPTHEARAPDFRPAARLPSLAGRTVGIISNGKRGTRPFFDAVERELTEGHGAIVVRRVKSNYSAPADPHILEEARGWDALIAGIGD